VHMLVDTKRNVVIVPAAAIQRGPQGTYVYVVSEGKTVNIRSVTVAETTGNNVGISSGLNAGDVVVIDGQDKLQDKSEVITSTAPAGGSASGASSQPTTQSVGQSHPKPNNPAGPQSGVKSR
jgi:multidrug efflux system membrane fusion protein